jgi:hypothetical protein
MVEKHVSCTGTNGFIKIYIVNNFIGVLHTYNPLLYEKHCKFHTSYQVLLKQANVLTERRLSFDIQEQCSIARQWLGKHIPAEANARKIRTSIARQLLGKHIPAATNTQTAIE